MKSRTKKLLKMLISGTCAFALAVPAQMAGIVKAEEAAEKASVDVYPKVQSMSADSEDGMKFDGIVDLVIHGTQIDATVPEIKALLEAEGISWREADEVTEGNASIVISSDADHCDDCAADFGDAAALEEAQGYVLKSSNDANEKGQVMIVGADGEGAYYGVLTLKQMLEQKTSDGRFAEVTISDWPDVKLRGFVEGFYGYPWSFEDRLGLMEDCGEFKMNTYIYAPKDDPYHRNQWRELYPEEEAENIRKLAEAGHRTNVSFCWSVHPGNGFNYNTDDDYNALIAKFEQLYSLGVRQFGISYDDLGGSDYYRGREHAQIINRVNQDFVKVKGDVKPLIVVATRYCASWGPSMSSYFKPFYETLNEDVVVMWTGNGTMSIVDKAAYDWPKNQTGVDRDLASWWNYPVNDYCDGKLLMAPLETLFTDVDNLSGFFLNPMSWAEASKVAIYSGADYSWNVADFDYMSSWKRAIEELVPDVNEAFERFADNISFLKDGFEFDESRYLKDKLDALTTAISNQAGIAEAAADLKAEFELIKQDVAALNAMENQDMLDDTQVHLNAYEELANAGIAGMDAFIAAVEGDVEGCLTNLNSMKEHLDKMATFKVTSLEGNGTKENIVDVGVKRIKPMLEDASSQAQAVLMAAIRPTLSGKVIASTEGLEDKEVEFSQGNYSVKDLAVTLDQDDYVGFMLPQAMNLFKIEVKGTPVESLKLQVSLNGIVWEDVETILTEDGLLTEDVVSATYVRVVSTEDQADVQISEFIVYPVYESETNPTVTTDLGTYQYYYIKNAMDGNMDTKFYSSAGTTAGSYVKVDLGKTVPIYDTTIFYAANPKGIAEGVDGFKTTKYEISSDGATWTQVGEPVPYTEYEVLNDSLHRCSVTFNADGQLARYLRFSATESYDNWVQIYEIEYNKTATNLGDAVVQLVESTVDVVGGPNLYDGNLSTAPIIDTVAEGDSLTYLMTTTTNVGKISMLQDAEAICNAKVEVERPDGRWAEVGTFDKPYQSFEVNEQILSVKLTFDGTVQPVIYEIIVSGQNGTVTPDPINPFEDVTEDDFFYDAVLWAAEKRIVEGYTDTEFAPDLACTRGEVVTFLWRANGMPKAEQGSGFKDVADDSYCAVAVAWAVENGITDGWTETEFAPEMTVTRGQAVTFLWRANGMPEAEQGSGFADVETDAYYADAVAWAVENGITNGWTETEFAPEETVTRGQAVTFLYRVENL
ncbi:MAG: beta-N-acetylglucosaminidase domain-containing protein [Lachnospiraceae bacterium]